MRVVPFRDWGIHLLASIAVTAPACSAGGPSHPEAGTPGSGACPVTGYAACGGDLIGTWQIAGHCPEPPDGPPCASPFSESACSGADNTVSCRLDPTGSMTFTATDLHLVRTVFIEATYVFSPECLAAVEPRESTPQARCVAVSKPGKLACAYGASSCTCVSRVGPENIDDMLPYTTSGSRLSIAGGEQTASYCVENNKLTLDFDQHPKSWRYWVLTK
jgi:hypothetical protein